MLWCPVQQSDLAGMLAKGYASVPMGKVFLKYVVFFTQVEVRRIHVPHLNNMQLQVSPTKVRLAGLDHLHFCRQLYIKGRSCCICCCLITAPVFWSKHSRDLAPRFMYGQYLLSCFVAMVQSPKAFLLGLWLSGLQQERDSGSIGQ